MADPIKLREMTASDAPAVVALVHAAFAAQPVVLDPPASASRLAVADVEAHLAAGGGGVVALAADARTTDRRIVGSVLWSEQDGGLYIARVAVDPTCRRRGIARALVAAAEAEGKARGLPRLHLGTRLALTGNRALFAACGFVEGRLHSHPGYAQPTWVEMEKWL